MTAVDSFAQLFKHASDHGANVWITDDHDTLVIEHINKAELSQGGFQF